MPQLHAGFLYGIPALMAGQILLSMAEQIPAQGRWFGFAAGLLESVPSFAWLAWMAGVLLLTVAWLVAARTVWRLARPQ
jgi:hypothetical protein